MSDRIEAAPAEASFIYKFMSALMAFALWGSWAFYINADSGSSARILAGLVQGSASFVITLVLVRAVTWISRLLPYGPAQVVVPALITVTVTGTFLVSIHTAFGTPNIAFTVTPALIVAFVFCLYTSYIVRTSKQR